MLNDVDGCYDVEVFYGVMISLCFMMSIYFVMSLGVVMSMCFMMPMHYMMCVLIYISSSNIFLKKRFFLSIGHYHIIHVNLDMTDSMRPGKCVRHMQNLLYTYDEHMICIGLGPSKSSVICNNPSYSCPSYPSSPVQYVLGTTGVRALDIVERENTQKLNSNSYFF